MKTIQRIIKNSYVQLKTDLPLFTESYHFTNVKEGDIHNHEFFEIGISIEGEGFHKTELGEQQLNRGHVYLIPIGKSHSILVPSFWHVQNIYFLPRLVYQNQNSTNSPNPLFNLFLLTLLHKDFQSILHLKLSESAVQDIEEMITAQQKISLSNKQLLENYQSNCLLNMLMIICESYYEAYPSDLLGTDFRILKILTILQEHLHLPTSNLIEIIRLQLNLHPQYINKIVKSTLGTTLSNLILETNIEKSCEYLLNHYSITDTAQILAFHDHSHYNKYFVKYFGITPSAYKDKYERKY